MIFEFKGFNRKEKIEKNAIFLIFKTDIVENGNHRYVEFCESG